MLRCCVYSDALIASVLDGVRASGNRDVHVKMKFTHRGHRLGDFTLLPAEFRKTRVFEKAQPGASSCITKHGMGK